MKLSEGTALQAPKAEGTQDLHPCPKRREIMGLHLPRPCYAET